MSTKEKQKAARKEAVTNKATAIINSKNMNIALEALEKIASLPDNVLNFARNEDRIIAKEALAKIKGE